MDNEKIKQIEVLICERCTDSTTNSPDDGLDREAIDEVAELISSKLLPGVVRIADKYNYDRDSMVKYCADLYSTMAELCTFENWKGGKE